MARLISGSEGIDASALGQMRSFGGTWAAYQNHDIGNRNLGHLKFLKVGEECTYKQPPPHFPADTISQGHVYVYVGMVNVETGQIVEN